MVQPPPARNREEQLATLIALMYRSAAEPELWGTFLERLGITRRLEVSDGALRADRTSG